MEGGNIMKIVYECKRCFCVFDLQQLKYDRKDNSYVCPRCGGGNFIILDKTEEEQ